MNRRSLTAPLVKSIIFVIITVTITAILGISIAYTGTSGNVGYKAVFSDVTGLVVGNDVDIAGVRVGTVTSISVYHRNEALVGFSLQQGRPLPASVTATIKYLNLVGQRYIELGQGTGPVDRTLPPGGTIPLNQTTPALNLTELFNGFQPLFQALSPGDVNKLSSEIIEVFQGESPGHRRAGRDRRLAHHLAGHQGPGHRRGDRQPQLGAAHHHLARRRARQPDHQPAGTGLRAWPPTGSRSAPRSPRSAA